MNTVYSRRGEALLFWGSILFVLFLGWVAYEVVMLIVLNIEQWQLVK